MIKKAYFSGFLVFGILLVLSLVFYKERMILPDDAFYLFDMCKKSGFVIAHFRFISIVTEWLPLLGIKLGLPLNVLAMCYSASFIIYYLVCYALCGLVLRNYKAGLAFLLYLILFTTHTFYWMLSELGQGIALLFVLYAWLSSTERPFRFSALSIIPVAAIIATLVFAHPLILFPFSFVLIFLFFNQPDKRRPVIAAAGLFILTLICKNIFFKEGYDSGAMEGVKNFGKLFPDYFTIHSTKQFVKNCFGKYWTIPVLSICIGLCYLLQRRYRRLCFFALYVIGFIMLVNVSFPDPGTLELYIENLYMPLGVFIALPFIYDVWPWLEQRRIIAPTFALLIAGCLIRIYAAHYPYTDRLNWQRSVLAQHRHEKVIIQSNILPMDKVLMTWCSAYEFWLLSTIEQHQTASVVIVEYVSKVMWMKDQKQAFVTEFGFIPYQELTPKYFSLPDTNTSYNILW